MQKHAQNVQKQTYEHTLGCQCNNAKLMRKRVYSTIVPCSLTKVLLWSLHFQFEQLRHYNFNLALIKSFPQYPVTI